MHSKRGFTLIEMLVVIAIIAILVSTVVPMVHGMTTKARAAADVANLRNVYATLNIDVVNGNKTVPEIINSSLEPTSKLDSDAVLQAVFDAPGFIAVFYVNEETGTYYSMDYLSDVAVNGQSTISTSKPSISGTWYQAGSPDPIS